MEGPGRFGSKTKKKSRILPQIHNIGKKFQEMETFYEARKGEKIQEKMDQGYSFRRKPTDEVTYVAHWGQSDPRF